jgi:hypothetical protein
MAMTEKIHKYSDVLDPLQGWDNKDEYKTEGQKLADSCEKVYLEFKRDNASEEVSSLI